MKKILTLLFLAVSVFRTWGHDYTFVALENQIVFEVCSEIIQTLYERLDMEISVVYMPGNRAETESILGSVDGEVGRISTFADGKPELIQVPTSYYQIETTAFALKDRNIQIESPGDLTPYSIAVMRGVINTDQLTKNNENLYVFDNIGTMMQFIELGRADMALTSKIGGLAALRKTGIKNVRPLPKPVVTRELYHYIHISHSDLVPLIDSIIKEMKASGELDELIKVTEEKILSRK
ncbi:MAG: transporter substrate-binding domain-containing protein [Spirochaetaceae bacterium]|nr:transporter substrate-binding domain-containing protein [Spirochaetaceae bacterium]